MWGIDAVHGHANIVGATIFPQNIGLGATRNPDLIRRIGEVTAREMAVTGIDWDFSPTLAVVRDDRWGRTYEGFSEDPEVVRVLRRADGRGPAGPPGTPDFLGRGQVIATAKHFVGDGGTRDGKDQGDNPSTPQTLRDIHGAGYPPAIEAGVQAVMASFSSVRGEKMHGNRELLTDALKGDMGFDGLGRRRLERARPGAGLHQHQLRRLDQRRARHVHGARQLEGLYDNTLAQARSGEIPLARLDDAVRRILRVKLRAGLFDKARPRRARSPASSNLLGSPEHRAVARQAVRESLVLLKNQGQLLPLSPRGRMSSSPATAPTTSPSSPAAGRSPGRAPTSPTRDFPNAQSIYGGIREAVSGRGRHGDAERRRQVRRKPDVAIVVFGEEPYAEFVGDRRIARVQPGDKKDLELMQQAEGRRASRSSRSSSPAGRCGSIPSSTPPTPSSRPSCRAAKAAASPTCCSTDRTAQSATISTASCPISWPKRADQTPLNRGDADYDPAVRLWLRPDLSPTMAICRGSPRTAARRFPAAPTACCSAAARCRRAGPGLDEGARRHGRGRPPGAGGCSPARLAGRCERRSRSIIVANPPIDISREATGELSLLSTIALIAPSKCDRLTCDGHGQPLPIGGVAEMPPAANGGR